MSDQHYVVDYLDCENTLQEAIDTIKTVIQVHKNAGFDSKFVISKEILDLSQKRIKQKLKC